MLLCVSIGLIGLFSNLAGEWNRLESLMNERGATKAFAKDTLSWAIVFAVQAALAVVAGAHGGFMIVTALARWRGRPELLALSLLIEKQFGIPRAGKP